MNHIFITVLNMSVTASFVAVIVIFARLLLKKAPKVFSYALWAVVLFRMLCPFSFESIVSILPIKQEVIQVPVNSDPEYPSVIESEVTFISALGAAYYAVGDTLNGGLDTIPVYTDSAPDGVTFASHLEVWIIFGSYIWLIGIIALILYAAISYLKIKRRVFAATLVRENIFETDRIQTPFVMGFIKPRIYIPVGTSETEADYIIKHERTHIKRADHLIKLLAFVGLALHWFNPLMWASYFLMTKDMELSCDESVLKRSGEDIRAKYSASLLSLSVKQSGLPNPLAFGESNVKSRIKNILKFRKHSRLIMVLAVILAVTVTIGCAMNRVNSGNSVSAFKSFGSFYLDGNIYGACIDIIDEKYLKLIGFDVDYLIKVLEDGTGFEGDDLEHFRETYDLQQAFSNEIEYEFDKVPYELDNENLLYLKLPSYIGYYLTYEDEYTILFQGDKYIRLVDDKFVKKTYESDSYTISLELPKELSHESYMTGSNELFYEIYMKDYEDYRGNLFPIVNSEALVVGTIWSLPFSADEEFAYYEETFNFYNENPAENYRALYPLPSPDMDAIIRPPYWFSDYKIVYESANQREGTATDLPYYRKDSLEHFGFTDFSQFSKSAEENIKGEQVTIYYNKGILGYNLDLKRFVMIELYYDSVTDEELRRIAETLRIGISSNENMTSHTAQNMLSKYLPAVIFDNMPDFREQKSDNVVENGTLWLWSAWNDDYDMFIHKIEFVVDDNNTLQFYHYMNYDFAGIPVNHITPEYAYNDVKLFARDFIPNGEQLDFINTPAYYSLYDPGRVESWVAQRDGVEYIIMVNLVYGYIEFYMATENNPPISLIDFNISIQPEQYNENPFYADDVNTIIHSAEELKSLCKDESYGFTAMQGDGTESMFIRDLSQMYNDEYFQDNALVAVSFEYSSSSIPRAIGYVTRESNILTAWAYSFEDMSLPENEKFTSGLYKTRVFLLELKKADIKGVTEVRTGIDGAPVVIVDDSLVLAEKSEESAFYTYDEYAEMMEKEKAVLISLIGCTDENWMPIFGESVVTQEIYDTEIINWEKNMNETLERIENGEKIPKLPHRSYPYAVYDILSEQLDLKCREENDKWILYNDGASITETFDTKDDLLERARWWLSRGVKAGEIDLAQSNYVYRNLYNSNGISSSPAPVVGKPYSYYPVFDKIEKIYTGSSYEPENSAVFMLSDEERAKLWRLMRIDEWVVASDLPLDVSGAEFSIHERAEEINGGVPQSWAFQAWDDQILIVPSLPYKEGIYTKKICYFAPADVLPGLIDFTEMLMPFSVE